MRLRLLQLTFVATLASSAIAQVPAPLPPSVVVDQFYPEQPRRLNLMARVVLRFQPSQVDTGVALQTIFVESIQIVQFAPDPNGDQERMGARLAKSAEALVKELQFSASAQSIVDKRVSVLFLLDRCDQMGHDSTADYYITVCRERYGATWTH